MNVIELLATLKAKDIQLAVSDDQLRVNGNKQALNDPALLVLLREHKPALIELIKTGQYSATKHGQVEVPANGIVPGTTRITPAMLTLVELDQATIDRLVEQVPGGAANVQDIYPLAPLQEGILYHHASGGEGDPYVMQSHFAFASRERFQAFAQALQTVIDRHDILRTAVFWQGLDAPVQVVWRRAELPVEAVLLPDADSDVLAYLHERFDARHFRLDVTRAPLMRLAHAWDEAGQRVVATLLFHHMALDHSALDVVRHEMRACLTGQSESLGRPVPFRNYVAQARLGVSEAEHEAFFRDMLGAIDEPTLPYGLQDVQGDGSHIVELSVPVETLLGQRLRAQARTLGVSVASLFHLGWAQVLAALTGKQQVVFGTVLMGRMQGAEAIDRALGIFINTLPLRVDIDSQDVRAAVNATHARLTTLMRHEHAPLALAQRCSHVVAPTPLFSTLLNYRHSHNVASASAQTLAAWDGISTLHSEERSNYPLTLSVDDLGDAFSLTLLASTQTDPQRICDYLHCALENLVLALEQAPQTPVNQLPILPAAELAQVLLGFNSTQVEFSNTLTIHQRFEARVAERPEAVAAVCADSQLTYAELNRQANALAHHLIERGVKPDDRVAIVARRGLDTLVGLVAILKAGAGYVPIDPAHPTERLNYLLGDSAPVAVLTQSNLRERLPALAVPVIELDRCTWSQGVAHDPQVPGLNTAHLAYVIYTSGSTGLPKGVMVEHHTLSNLVDWHCAAFDLCAGRHTSSLAGFGFDAMAWEVWPALCAGATLHLAPTHEGGEDIDALLAWWCAQPLDVSFLPTPVAEYAFSQHLEHPTLRTLLIGGDRLRQFNRHQHFDVINNYGPTEATVVATSGLVESGDALHIGQPVSNATVYLLDEQQRPVPIGVAGELYVGGVGVARGYLNRPEMTAERFLRDPFNTAPNARMYRTGDLARWRADGNIEYLGRNDDQVKIRGVRIELGEIETCLNQLPGIQEAVLLAREDQPGQPRLVAYFTEQAQVEALPVGELRAQLLSRLPEYMVPVAFVKLAALPLTANGKVDRRALPAPDLAALFTREYVAPEGEVETALAQIWADVLQVEQVGRLDHFFELGGHSLLAMRMVSQVRQRLGVELALGDLFANAELAAVALLLSAAGRSAQPQIVPVARDGALPLSFAQQRLWFLAQMEGANTAYNIPVALRLRGRLDDAALQRALARIVARHETLRSRFAQFNDEAQVLIAPVDTGLLLRVEDLRQHPQPDETLQALIQGEASGPFDLQDDPLIRGRLVRLADDHHVLLLTLHHIISDGWSMGVLTRELMALYQAFSHGQPDPLPPLALQYTDYAVWQRRWLSGEVLQRQSEYWQQTLAGAPALLMLPTDRPRPAQQDYAGSSVAVVLDERLSAGLKALGQRHGVTLYMTLMSAWAMLLSRLSGQSDVVIGSPVANRTRAEIEGLIGMFVNTLALRIDTSGELSVEALLARVKAQTLLAQAHQDLTFEQVVEVIRPVRSLAHSPVFQTLLSWDGLESPALALGELTLEGVAEPSHFAKFDLSLNLSESNGVIRGSLEYATALFDETTVQRFVGYLQRLLQAMVANDQAVLEHAPLLAQEEQQRLLVEFNATDVGYDLQQTIHGLFEAQVQRSPQAPAVVAGELALTYAELNARANQLARHLRELGVQADSRVGICVERGLDMVVGLLAILKAGGGYVPLDPAYPLERLAYMLEDSAPLAVLVQGSTRSLLGDVAVPLIDLDQPQWQVLPTDNLAVAELTPQHTAYVIYTSGSTGQPKGVINEHSGVVNRLLWMQDAYQLTAADTVLQKTPFSFDVSVWEFFWPLMTGARLVMARPEGHKDPLYLSEIIEREHITTLHFVPSMLDVFLAHADTARCGGLRQVMCSGEALPGSVVRRFKQQLPGSELHNLYGPTEAAVDVTAWNCAGPLEQTPDNTPIGKPIANTRMYILGAQQQPVPHGVVGELYIGGVQVARGYLNRPELSAERFLDDPFQANGRMYRTGDVARYLPDGNIEYLGRNDDQMKIRGLRIELGEIQARLTQIDGVQEAAVLAREDVPGDKRLVAYYTGARLEVDVLRSHLLERLPDYMVPAVFVHLDVLPLSPNGKLDRKALPAPDLTALTAREYEAPLGEVEIALAQLWAELLNVERVGRHDHFFELGGHSLLAVNLVAKMRRAGLSADIRVLFNQPTLAALAAAVGGEPEAEVAVNLITADCTCITPELLPLVALDQPSIDRIVASIPGGVANVQDIYPLAPLQTGILFHHLSAVQGDPYVLQAQFAFAAEQRLQAFTQALQSVIQRHDILRTSLFWDGLQDPVQVVWREAPLACESLALDSADGDVLEQLRARFDAGHYRMAVNQAPLMRVVHAWDDANQRVVALLLFHHLIMDHVALEVLQHEMQAFLVGLPHRLAEPVPYRNYVAHTLSGLSDQQHENFFRDMLGDVDEPTLPYGQNPPHEGLAEQARLTLDATLSRTLRSQARRLGVSAASLMHLAWAQVLGQLSGRDDVVFGTVLLGRLQGGEGAERALGVFINTLPLRIDLSAHSVKGAALATHQLLSQLLQHEHAQLARIQHCSAMAPTTPLFSTLFNYRHGASAGGGSAEAQAAWQGMQLLEAEEHSNYRLTLSVDDLGEGFSLAALAGAGIDAQRTCDYLQCALYSLVEALEHAPHQGLERLSILPVAEREQLLVGFNATGVDYPQGLTIAQRFEQQVAERPQALAAQSARVTLSYAELNRQANALAHHLIAAGVQPDDRVAIVARRGLDTLVGLVAILKAGAGYVPVDPAHPAERLGYLLQDSAPVAVLTQSDLRARLPALAVPVIDLDQRQWSSDNVVNPVLPALTPQHLAYVIYTSGSTGLPKGVMVEHHTLSNLVDWHCEAFDLHAGGHTSSLAGFGFDAMAWEVWPALCCGATLHLAPSHDGNEDIDALLDWWRAQPLDVSFLPTPVAEYAFSQGLTHPTLKTLLIGGDRLRQFTRNQAFRVINNYGPTEATVVATSGLIEAGGVLHIGKPLSNATVYLLDGHQRPVPLGVMGELYVGGAGVARGYLNRPDMTAERFLHDPFSPLPNARMYRSGDLARWREDGTLEYLGRNDDQVKIRGVRIELGEIETRLNQLPGIQDAVLLAREDEPGQPRLVAYYTGQGEPLSVAELREHLSAQLPEYMVPAAFVRLNALPLTANGKVDRKALPKPDLTALFTREYAAPQGALETALAQIWADVLHVERVGRHDHFFELGGHSLLAMRMVAQVRQQMGLELVLADLFANAELAAVAECLRAAEVSSQPPIVAVPRDGTLSFAQQRLWFLAQMSGGNSAYNIPIGLRLRGRLDDEALQRALVQIVARHETLRSRFVSIDDQAQVTIAPVENGLLLQTEDLRQDPQAEASVQALLAQEAATAFDLQHDPLIRGRLVQMADDHHVLLLTVHHIVADGWSMGVLTRELMALYQAFSQGQSDPLPPLALQYGDYAVWQRRWLSGEVLQRQSDYWQQTLDGAPALLTLPTDRPRPPQQDFAGSSVEVRLDGRMSNGLKALSQRHGVTLFMTLMSAWSLLLSRLSGQSDVVIGSPVANRTRAEVEGLIGMFVNTLALRIDTSGEPSVAALLARVKAQTLQAQAHQDLPFEQVVEIARPVRSLAHSPLFQTTLSWDSNVGPNLALGDLSLEGVAAPGQVAKFDLTLTLGEANGVIRGSLEYATALFDQATIQRYVGYLQCVLAAMVSDDQAVLERVQLLAEDERQRLLCGFNATAREYPQTLTVHGVFQQQAAAHPKAVAAVHGEHSLSYFELNAQANRLAHHLISQGVQAGDPVAILLPRSLELLVAQLAIAKCAAAYVPLDINAPSERQAFMVEDCQAVALLTLSSEVIDYAAPRIDLDRLKLSGQPTHNPNLLQSSETLAYIMYTSGSTGTPKGVMVPHRAIGRLVLNNGYADFNAQDRVVFASNPAFDASTMDIWGPLLNGGRVVVIDHPTLLDPNAFGRELSASGATVLFVTTALFNQYVQLIAQALKGLRILLCGGERGDPAAFRTLRAEAPQLRIVHCYGPTETTTYATTFEVLEVAENAESVPIGGPISNTQVYVLDAHQQPVPMGVTGELYIGGQGVALGYLNRPDLTAEKFLRDPFSERPGALLYRTGDLARWLAPGQLDCIGRNDDQVKIRGFRIELGEIESRLLNCAGVKEAVVLARRDGQETLRLVAYYTAHEQPLDSADLHAQLQARLPEYMVPSAWVQLAVLPLNNNGKIDRKALPAPTQEALLSRAYEPPANALEASLARVWADVLQVAQVGRHDNFFELGGHSLLAMRMLSQVRQQLGIELALGELFANPELAAVADVLSRAGRSTLPDILPAPRDQVLPLSFAQQRLWFLAQMGGGNSAYNIPVGLRLRGRLDEDALQRALARIVARHETLRSRFHQLDDEAQVLILPVDSGLLLRVEDLRGYPQADEALRRLAEAEASAPFNLQEDPLLRGRLVRLADDHHVLLLTLHHIVSDGWSMGVLTRELAALYQAFSHGQPDPLPPLALQYTDYAVWQRRWLSGEVLQRQSDYWQQALAGAPALLTLPTDRPRPAQQDHSGASVEIQLGEAVSSGIKTLCQRRAVTPYMVIMSAWAMTLSRLSGQSEVVIGSPVANRTRAEIEGLIGMFVNTLALRIDTSDEPSGEALLARVKAQTLQAQAHQDLPFEQVVEICKPLRSLSHSALFQTLLSWDNNDGPALTLGDLTLEGVAGPSRFVKFDLSLTLGEHPSGIRGALNYATALFDEATIRRFVGYFQQLLAALVNDDQVVLAQVPLLAADERQRLLVDFNATQVDCPLEQPLHGLFEAQVRRRPDAVAVQTGERSLSYRELNERANRLAHHLRELGVQPDVRVAICVERGLDLVVGLLGILKAGGAYVPLDPSYPAERLAYMLKDSAPTAVLVQTTTRGLFDSSAATLIDLDHSIWQNMPEHDPQVPGLSPSNLAYMIYTSGSTGLPKGVMIEHRSACNMVHWGSQLSPPTEHGALLQKAPFSFDSSVWEIFWPLCSGMRLVLARPDGNRDSAYVVQTIREHQVTVVKFVPALLQQFIEQDDVEQCTSLTDVLNGGGELSAALARQVRKRLPWVRLHNVYGPTETTVDSTGWTLEPHMPVPDNVVPVGKALSNTRLYVLDAYDQPVPQGVSGQLHIGGVGVARGYHGLPEMQAERFIDSPFVAGDRLYRTGDLVRYANDGELEFLGRNDFQIKLRGLRLEPGEIEARLIEHSAIREAVVMVRDERLVAWYTVRSGVEEPSLETLRAHVLERLPEYMVPGAFVQLDALPLTPNDKIDRKALPEPGADAVINRPYVAPQGEVEATLAQIWGEVLGVEQVGRHDNFFELGGHSLLAVRLVNLMQRTGLTLSLAELFQHPSVESAAALLSQGEAGGQADGLVVVRAGEHGTPLFLMHEFSGRDVYFPTLAQHIGGEFPIYGLPGVTLGQAQLRTIECMAQRMVGIIRAVQPHGPYRLAGWSFGGVLAHEVAQQLLGLDEPVEFIGMLDSYAPNPLAQDKAMWSGEGLDKRQLLGHCRGRSMMLGAEGEAALAAVQALEAQIEQLDFTALFQRCQAQQLTDPELASVSAADAWHYFDREAAHRLALAHYRVSPASQTIHLFRAQELMDGQPLPSPTRGWEERFDTGLLRCIDIPGDHRTMMKPPHIQALGQALTQALDAVVMPEPAPYQPLLTIQTGHAGHAPIFCVPGAGDSVTGFIHLTEAIGPEWPIIGLQPRGLDGVSVPHSEVEAAAAFYLQAIEQIYPQGPVHLIGHSFGGWVAHAMAAQLQQAGREVASLTLIDSEAPGGDGTAGKPYTATAALQRLIDTLQLSCGKSLGIDPAMFANADDTTQLRLLHEGMVRAGVLSERAAPDAMHGPVRTFATALRTVYQPRLAYTGPVRLVLVDDPTLDEWGNQREQAAMLEGWQRRVDDLAVWYGPGNHFTILKAPNVFSFAAWWHDGLSVAVGPVLS
ncbi:MULTISPECIES: non-ribosomal peptide synthase/polyketide synthase [unclassified Pseudomonas]|uniref:non-ribosomal peptide synthase/polyketide synthase n=1 Tax=unclassified Pseudomonas TaxID=196821 RepID=UPI002A365005|nr:MULTISPECIES: non-ribosomal peptide synthase/polyketide synthase [unclassified Pseudomonas]MDX9669520.1 non-ribosomal peptide synthase/polyketide synthase [Pseudomonas sp. P8_250]WPN36443.1 non-ribosomal peptide synthase/polyketide synthase [Pseudomonas sp. P8_139]WPN41756.1 non-ribosomal peptide synthase/polyketide synthase [Pseudomonas sp. P8_229]